jgi:integrase
MKLPRSWPKVLTNGVKIYRVRNGDYQQFRVASYDSAKNRKFQVFSSYDEAHKVAAKINEGRASGDVEAIVLTGAQKLEYVHAVNLLKPLGISLDSAARQLTESLKLIPDGSLIEAARHYAKTHPAKLPRKSVSELVEEFATAKTKAGKSEDYLADIRYRCGRFAEAFQCSIGDVTRSQVQQFLDGLGLSGRSVNNFKRSIVTLFEFAKARGYLPKDHDELASIEAADEGEGEIEIYTPDEMTRLLSAARPDFLPVLAIGGFAGVRAKEIERLTWLDVWQRPGYIEVKAYRKTDAGKKRVAKTARRRLVPMLPNLAQWLAPYAQQTGRVWSHSEAWFEESKRETAARAKVAWKHNALRHSFISYRLADVQDMAKVALEAGNSPQMIFESYRELVTPAEAKAWFAICP